LVRLHRGNVSEDLSNSLAVQFLIVRFSRRGRRCRPHVLDDVAGRTIRKMRRLSVKANKLFTFDGEYRV
jgi:hypothetical protein